MNILFIIPFLISIFFARKLTASGYENKLIGFLILIGLLGSPFLFLFEILSWFDIKDGPIALYTCLIFNLVLLLYLANLNKKE